MEGQDEKQQLGSWVLSQITVSNTSKKTLVLSKPKMSFCSIALLSQRVMQKLVEAEMNH